MIVLSLDPSVTSTGYCIANEKKELIAIGKIPTLYKKEYTKSQADKARTLIIADKLKELIIRYSPDIVVAEDIFVSRINFKTSIQLARLQGCILTTCNFFGLNLETIPVKTIRKRILDNGQATKQEVAIFIQDKYKDNKLIQDLGEYENQNNKNKNSDIFDAIAVNLAY